MLLVGKVGEIEFAIKAHASEGRKAVISPERVEVVQHPDPDGWNHDCGGVWA